MYPIEVYKISKESVMCESVHNLQVASFDRDVYMTDRLGDTPTEAKIKHEWWKIKKFTNAKDLGYGKHSYIDKYIAVDPVLEELLTIELTQKHEQELISQYNNLSSVIDDITKVCDEYSDRLVSFYKLPWYRRIWNAIKNDV